MTFCLKKFLCRQRDFSVKTFGPGPRTEGLIDHIKKELVEIAAKPHDLEEWVDLLLLSFDGPIRMGFTPNQVVHGLEEKLKKNMVRKWPDWRTVPAGKAIEHIR